MTRALTARRSHRQAGPLLVLMLLMLLTACASNTGAFSGGSWQASGLQKQQLRVLAVDPNHPRNIYAGDERAGVFASTDAGVNWKASSLGLPTLLALNALSFDLSGKNLYAATSLGLFVSHNSASSWQRVKSIPTDSYSALSFDIATPGVIYTVGTSTGIWMSRDEGTTWTGLSKDLPTVPLTSVLYDPTQQDLWAASASSIYRSSDSGATWRVMNTGLPANVGINVLALGALISGSSDLIFAGTDHGFFFSSNAGQSWTQSQLSLANLKISAILLDASQPMVVYISSDIGVLRSSDSGQNWNEVASGLPNNQPFAGLAQGDVNNAQLLLASRGVYRYPGTASPLDPSRLLPILLVLLFFFLLYFFFARRLRQRATRRRSPPAAPAESAPEVPPTRDTLNGLHPPSESVPEISEDEKEES